VSRSRRSRLRFLVTAGPTREYIDPVRFITNKSSGLVGYLVARAALRRGHEVILLSGPTTLKFPRGVRGFRFETAVELQTLALRFFPDVDAVVATAAVGDFRPVHAAVRKIKKDSRRVLTMKFMQTPDVLKSLGLRKKNQVLVGFSLETDRIARYAREKLTAKKLDFVVANMMTPGNSPFGNTAVSGMIISHADTQKFKDISKQKLAGIILDRVERVCYSLKVVKNGGA